MCYHDGHINVMTVSIIVAAGENNEIGQGGGLLCHLPADLRRFKEITSGHAVVMGRVTFDSLPKGALPNRRNIVVSRNRSFIPKGVEVFFSPESFFAGFREENGEVFIIGGEQIYRLFICFANRIYLTRIHALFPQADAFFPEIDMSCWREMSREDFSSDEQNPFSFSYITYDRVSH
jgi:dihydrofolate reductase